MSNIFKKPLWISVALVAAMAGSVAADNLKQCTLSMGKVRSCPSAGYSGTAVVEKDGKYKECTLSMGKIRSCPSAGYSGTAVVEKDGKFKECTLSMGNIRSCPSAGYSGTAVVPK